MNVLYTCDNNYVWIMGISAISLFESNKEMNEINVFLLGENISSDNKEKLKEIGEKYNRCISVIDVPEFDIPDSVTSARWPLSAFTRLFSAILLPNDVHRVLYLDCDTIVNGSIEPLDAWDMEGHIFCGVKDCISAAYKKNIGLDGNDSYINAGVLLIDLEKLKEMNMTCLINAYMEKYEKLISYADQDLLNGLFCKKIGYLPPEYDVMTIDVVHSYDEIITLRRPTNFYDRDEIEYAANNPIIVHYTTNMLVIRPWFLSSNHPFKSLFDKNMMISPWNGYDKKPANFGKTGLVLKIIGILPRKLAYALLGWIHSEIKPKFIKCKSAI